MKHRRIGRKSYDTRFPLSHVRIIIDPFRNVPVTDNPWTGKQVSETISRIHLEPVEVVLSVHEIVSSNGDVILTRGSFFAKTEQELAKERQ